MSAYIAMSAMNSSAAIVSAIKHVYEIRPRKNHRAVVVIFAPAGAALGSAAADSPGMAFGSGFFAAPLPATAARCSLCLLVSRAADAVICVYDDAGNVIETHEHNGEFKEP